jgi:hypothetical protein
VIIDTEAYKNEVLRGEHLGQLRAAAAPALNHPRPLEMFKESCRGMGLGANLTLATTVYLAATTRVIGRRKRLQAHTFVLGLPSSGKSFEMDAALAHLPADAIKQFDGCSPRALIYSDGAIQHKVLVYSELDGLPLGQGGDDGDVANAALTYLRTLVVNGIAHYDVVVKVKEGFTTVRYTKEGPAALVVTGTRRIGDEQLRSRLHEVEVVVDKQRLAAVIGAQGRLLGGGSSLSASKDIIALQSYLQALAPIEVVIPFAEHLGRAILAKAKMTDPRLTREFPRIAGFTAAHALLSIERRERDDEGNLVATVEDYEAARAVIVELSTTRELSKSAIEAWETVCGIHAETKNPVTVGQVTKKLMKDNSGIRRNLISLVEAGALTDVRDRRGKTSPLLVVPSGDDPRRVPLPTLEDMGLPPRKSVPSTDQVVRAHGDNFGSQADSLGSQVMSLVGKEITSTWDRSPGVNAEEPARDVYRHGGIDYRVGDVLPDGRTVLSVDDGIPVLTMRPLVPDVAGRVHQGGPTIDVGEIK